MENRFHSTVLNFGGVGPEILGIMYFVGIVVSLHVLRRCGAAQPFNAPQFVRASQKPRLCTRLVTITLGCGGKRSLSRCCIFCGNLDPAPIEGRQC